MLPRINRLKKERDFKKIYRFGEKKKGTFFVIRYNKNNLPYSRFGIVIPSSVIKKATKRNYFRRRISEAIRLNLNAIKKGQDIAFLVFKAPEIVSVKDFEQEILDLIKKAGLFDDKKDGFKNDPLVSKNTFS